jgi:formylglycine-generating enzyme required for sulfatase activity
MSVESSAGSYRANHSGSWDDEPRYAWIAYRGFNPLGARSSALSFRLVRRMP